MGKYFVNEVKHGVSGGGIACGPVEGSVNVSLNVSAGDKTFWITNSELTGIPNFYLTDEDIFNRLMNNDISDEFVEFMSERFIEKFEGITLGDYDTIFESIKENDGNPAVPLIRYIILLTRCSEDNVDEIIALAKGKFVDEIVIPQNDTEIKDFQ